MIYKVLVISGLSLLPLMSAGKAEAGFVSQWTYGYNNYHRPDRHHRRHHRQHHRRHARHHHPSYGKMIWGLPHGYISIVVGGSKYYYDDGIYYQRHGHGYRVTHAPIGACLRRLPRGHKTVHHRGHEFYKYNGVYYKHSPAGYVVVSEPYVIKEVVKVKDNERNLDGDDPLVVNVPNEDGGYTAVKLTREGEGFVGPQGEYYYDFPNVERLKLIYGSS